MNPLKKTLPTWYYAPLRRVVQSLCLLLFLVLFFYVCWPYSARPAPHPIGWPSHYADGLRAKEIVEAESFLALDPLVSFSGALAARAWVWSLAWAGLILAVCLLVPRGFCGYVCPLGTLLDLFDWALGKRITRFLLLRDGWWVQLKYYLLLGTLVAALCGVLLSGFVAAIPVLTRGLLFVLAPLQLGFLRGWHQVPPFNAGHYVSVALFLGVFALGFWGPRFWCRYVCPSGAVFSVFNLLRVNERKVAANCVLCGKCSACCPFDAIQADFKTRTADCAFCKTCRGVCPTDAIKFASRWDNVDWKEEEEPRYSSPEGGEHSPSGDGRPTSERPAALWGARVGSRWGRRGFLAGALGSLLVVLGQRRLCGSVSKTIPLVRPPGSVPEEQFLQLCIRCGECFKVCPNNVLQPVGFERGLDELWTPKVVANWAGCESSCNACGQVCPTGAVRALPLKEKRVARMGLAIVNQEACLPYAGLQPCQMCVDECSAAGYNAIEFMRVRVETGDEGAPIEGSGFVAPVVVPGKCVGCGLCQTRCYQINAKSKGWLRESAILVAAGSGKEDRLLHGSYLELRRREASRRRQEQQQQINKSGLPPGQDIYLPDFLK